MTEKHKKHLRSNGHLAPSLQCSTFARSRYYFRDKTKDTLDPYTMEEVLRLYRSPYVDRLPEPERTERYQSLAVLMAQFDYQFNRAAKEEEWRASGAVHEWAQRKEQPDDDDDYDPYQEMLDEWEQKQWEGCVATAREWAGNEERYKGLGDGQIVGCWVRSRSY